MKMKQLLLLLASSMSLPCFALIIKDKLLQTMNAQVLKQYLIKNRGSGIQFESPAGEKIVMEKLGFTTKEQLDNFLSGTIPTLPKPKSFQPDIKPTEPGLSQTEGYLKSLAPNQQQAYAKIRKLLVAPDPVVISKAEDIKKAALISTDPEQFTDAIDQAIATEKKFPNHYAFYHASQKEGILLSMLRTYILQAEQGWDRDDFFILRQPSFFYDKSAKTADDFIMQNLNEITHQYHQPDPNAHKEKQNCIDWMRDNCRQFDLDAPYRNFLISTSPAFIAGVDDTSNELRSMSDMDYAAWESSFYYFATNLSWSSVRRLFSFLATELKQNYPSLFDDTPINIDVRKYIAIKFNNIVEIIFPKAFQQLTTQENLFAKSGMMFQFLIPKDIVDDVAYLAWANGILWQRTINNILDGWNNTIGAYTKISPILDLMKQSPEKLGKSINLLQARLILKDKKYFYDGTSPIKINLIHSFPPGLFTVIKDTLKNIATVIVENKKSVLNGTQQKWFERADIHNFVTRYEKTLQEKAAKNDLSAQINLLNILYFYKQLGIEQSRAHQIAEKFKNSAVNQLKDISKDILK